MKRTRSKTHSAASQPRPPRRQDEIHDVYGIQHKLPDPTCCPTCGALYRDGRWIWHPAPVEAQRVECPACRRIADHQPAGILLVHGEFPLERLDEIEHLLRHVEEREKAEHALKRIMAIEPDEEGGLRVSTTSGKLARSLGTALFRAYRGELEQSRPDADEPVRVRWTRG